MIAIDAGDSEVPRCIDGVAQYLFAVDVDGDGLFRRGLDAVVRDWTDDASSLVTPQGDTDYLVGVRCGSEPTCDDYTSIPIEVGCPTGPSGLGTGSSSGTSFLGRTPLSLRSLRFVDKISFLWASSATVDVVRGDLGLLRGNFGFAGSGSITACLVENGLHTRGGVDLSLPPLPGNAWFYLARSAEQCNQKAGGSWGQVGEASSRDVGINNEANSCIE